MKVLITGAMGFIGSALTREMAKTGHQVTAVDRASKPKPEVPSTVRYICADTTQAGPWQEAVREQDAIVNLAGATIFRRWNPKVKEEIRRSRIETTRRLVSSLPKESSVVILNASAVGFYGPSGDGHLRETDPPGTDFLAGVCMDWEREALRARDRGARVVLTRFGIVLGRTGGALKQMLPVFRAGLGGPLGSGRQWFSWIHIEDLIQALFFILDRPDIQGPVNFCSPHPVRNDTFARTLAQVLRRPCFLRTPGLLLRLVMGEFGSVLLEGQRAFPEVLLRNGYAFRYPELRPALENLTA